VLKWLGITALAAAAFVLFMAAGSGRAAESGSPAKAAPAKPAPPSPAESTRTTPTTKDGGAKPAAAAETTSKEPKDAKAAPKDSKDPKEPKDAKAVASDTKEASKGAPAESSAQRRSKAKRKRDGSAAEEESELPPGQGPPPPSPLSVNDLHQEANRERGPGGDFNAPPRVKLEQLLSEVSKARQGLHEDTLKLEALAGNDASHAAEPAAADPAVAPAPGAPGQPPQKNPLDVLAKALRGIKPEQAGPIVARLDKGLAATVLLKMPPADAGKIMGALKPEVAAELATQIAMRAPSSQPGGKR